MPKKGKRSEPKAPWEAFAFFLILGAIIYIWFTFLIGNVQDSRIIDASRFTVQIDSFLTAGFIVGVFWYWEALLKRLKEVRIPFLYPSETFVTLVSPFAGFALSSFLALGGILTGSIAYLEWAIYFTAYAVISIFILLYQLNKSMGEVEKVEAVKELQESK